jgi:DNA-binding MarR family transcriptional regulator
MSKKNPLALENQLCFAMYSTTNALTRAYGPLLKPFGLTYLQYICLLVLWEKETDSNSQPECISVSDLSHILNLESSTLTPLLKKLEQKSLILRERNPLDERVVQIQLTEDGKKLKQKIKFIPEKIFCKSKLSITQAKELKTTLTELLSHLQN